MVYVKGNSVEIMRSVFEVISSSTVPTLYRFQNILFQYVFGLVLFLCVYHLHNNIRYAFCNLFVYIELFLRFVMIFSTTQAYALVQMFCLFVYTCI